MNEARFYGRTIMEDEIEAREALRGQQLGLALAQHARDEHAEHHGELLALLRSALAGSLDHATADDAHVLLDLWGFPADFGGNRRFLGALWDADWEATGEWVPSRRAKCHGRPIRVWRLKP